MEALWAALLALVAAILLGFSAYALWVGVIGGLLQERVERCERCHRWGLTTGGKRHRSGCPSSLRDRVVELLPALHVRHH